VASVIRLRIVVSSRPSVDVGDDWSSDDAVERRATDRRLSVAAVEKG